MQAVLTQRIEKGSFKIDFTKENRCKGVLMLEVIPFKSDEPLILNRINDDLITKEKPFKLESHYPITDGSILNFTPQNGSKSNQTLVRMLLVK